MDVSEKENGTDSHLNRSNSSHNQETIICEGEHFLNQCTDGEHPFDDTSSCKTVKTTEKANHMTDVHDTTQAFNEKLSGTKSKNPGVILLGRGNSFCLGRSEVILLHHKPTKLARDRKSKRRSTLPNRDYDDCPDSSINLHAINERSELRGIKMNADSLLLKSFLENQGGFRSGQPENSSPSPPPISNGLGHVDLSELPNRETEGISFSNDVLDLTPGFEDELVDLWHKAESLMIQKNEKVLDILKDFGIGEPGSGGGEDVCWEDEETVERRKEEEEVWEIIQDNFRV